MYELQPKTKFRRDIKLANKRGVDFDLLHEALGILSSTGSLPPKYKPHPLKGEYKGCIDAHIQPDWVLIYEVDEEAGIIVLHRTGRHQDVFKSY